MNALKIAHLLLRFGHMVLIGGALILAVFNAWQGNWERSELMREAALIFGMLFVIYKLDTLKEGE